MWAADGCRLTRAGGMEIPQFQQNICDQQSQAPREGNKASLSLVPPVNIRMVCAFLFLILSFFSPKSVTNVSTDEFPYKASHLRMGVFEWFAF